MRLAHLFAVLGLVATLVAANAEPELGRPVELKPDETVVVEGLSITFEGVSQESRCPTGVECMWAGDAAAAFTLAKKPKAAVHLTLHTNSRFERQTDYEGLVVRLEDLKPYPTQGATIARGDYRATVVVTRP